MRLVSTWLRHRRSVRRDLDPRPNDPQRTKVRFSGPTSATHAKPLMARLARHLRDLLALPQPSGAPNYTHRFASTGRGRGVYRLFSSAFLTPPRSPQRDGRGGVGLPGRTSAAARILNSAGTGLGMNRASQREPDSHTVSGNQTVGHVTHVDGA